MLPLFEQWTRQSVRRLGIYLVATGAAMSGAAEASCRFPERATKTPAAAARLLFDGADALGFAVVKRRLGAGESEEISMLFSLKGPQQTLALRSPYTGKDMIVTNSETTFGAAEGTVVFAALRRTPSGWVTSECDAQLMNAFPLEILIPELRREFLRRAD
jgi:hypothetical protein